MAPESFMAGNAPTKDEEQALFELVYRVLKGRSQELFEYLRDNRTDDALLSGRAIQKHFKSHEEGYSRTAALRLGKALDRYFLHQGHHEYWRIELPKAQPVVGGQHAYRLRITRNLPTPDSRGLWVTHLRRRHPGSGKPRINYFILTEPVFFRDADDTFYIRHFTVNNEAEVARLKDNLPGLAAVELVPSPHYVSIGEVRAMTRLTEALHNIRPSDAQCKFVTNREAKLEELGEENVVLLGTTRANPSMSALQDKFDLRYRLLEYHVAIKGQLTESEAQALVDQGLNLSPLVNSDGHLLPDLPGDSISVIFSRLTLPDNLRTFSAIASNHGPATQAVAEYLLSDGVKNELVPKLQQGRSWEGFPASFQVLFRVDLWKGGRGVRAIRYVCSAVFPKGWPVRSARAS